MRTTQVRGDKNDVINLLPCWWECKLVQPLWRTVSRFLKKLKIELPYDLAIPLLGVYLDKTVIQEDTRTPMFIAALFPIARTWKQPTCPSAKEWIKRMCVCVCVCMCLYIYINGMLLSHKQRMK